MRWHCNERKPNYAMASDREAAIGFSDQLPTGRGLLCFNNLAVAAVTEIDRNYPQHMRAARELAQEYLSSEKRLPAMLSACG